METIEARWISPVNDTNANKVAEIAASMKANGWIGRPIIAWNDDGSHWQAFTGSHRIMAAREVEIDVPVFEITMDAINAAAAYLEENGRDVEELIESRDDYDRETIFAELAEQGIECFAEALEILRQEDSFK
jgi:ParB-like chromosome segregation protein Spo0J